MRRVDMHRLQELVRLRRMGTGARESARLLEMSPTTERHYRTALASASLLEGPVDALPDPDVLRRAVELLLPSKPMPQHESSVARWTERVTAMLEQDATPTAIYDCLRLQEDGFTGSLSAIKRMCLRLRAAKGISADDVAIPVETDAGEVAQASVVV